MKSTGDERVSVPVFSLNTKSALVLWAERGREVKTGVSGAFSGS